MLNQKRRTADLAMGRWPGILFALGVEERFLKNKHGACPCCNGKDRYRFDDKGRGTWFCSQCGSGDGFALLSLIFGWSFSKSAAEVDKVVGNIQPGPIITETSDAEKLAKITKVWKSSKKVVHGDPVWKYLNRRTGIDVVPINIRYLHSMKYVNDDGEILGNFPVMIARLSYPDGTGASLHRTYLTQDGQKADVPKPKKMMTGLPIKTASVALGSHSGYVGIAEGIETALSASMRFQVPVWAATNAGLLESWIPPDDVRQVLICADNDANASWAGQAAAYSLAKRLASKGIIVDVKVPETPGTDWADK